MQWKQLSHVSWFCRLHFGKRNEYQADLLQSRIRSREFEMPLLIVLTSLPRHSVVCFHPCFCQNLSSRARNVLFTCRKHSSSKATVCIKLWEALFSSRKLTAKMLLKITRPTFSVRHFLRLKVAATNSVKEKSCSCGEKPAMSQSQSDVKWNQPGARRCKTVWLALLCSWRRYNQWDPLSFKHCTLPPYFKIWTIAKTGPDISDKTNSEWFVSHGPRLKQTKCKCHTSGSKW